MPENRSALAGSHRNPLPGARVVGLVDTDFRMEVTVYVRRKAPLARHSGRTRRITRQAFAGRHGADSRDIARIRRFAANYNLDIVDVRIAQRAIVLSGRVADLNGAFGVQLRHFEYVKGGYIGRTGPITIPAGIAGVVAGVFGLDLRPAAYPHFRLWRPSAIRPAAGRITKTYTPLEIATAYAFPPGDGSGECIALIELGGGFTSSDLNTYFSGLGLTSPQVLAISVDGAVNAAVGDPNSADGEVMLDIEVAGAIGPNAKIGVYFAPNSDRGFVDAITTAIHDTVNNPSIISISWGGAEDTWPGQTRKVMDQAFQDAAALGISVLVASGDDGSTDRLQDGKLHVDFPAASPNVIACGGTSLIATGSKITSEVTWNNGVGFGATGGGVSRIFPKPTYQRSANVPSAADDNHIGRGVPDIAGDADPSTGYQVRVDGQNTVVGGTSAVAPLYAGLLARINQALRGAGLASAGFINPLLYGAQMVPNGYGDVVSGNNNVTPAGGAYNAGAGWDACTGLGSVRGNVLMQALIGAQPTPTPPPPTPTPTPPPIPTPPGAGVKDRARAPRKPQPTQKKPRQPGIKPAAPPKTRAHRK
jgi:kumamolisin